MASNTSVAIASNALVMIGSQPISAFTDDDGGATVANELYEDIIEELIAEKDWTFAKKMSTSLSRLAAEPEVIWDAAYQLPSDLIDVRTILVGDSVVDYEVYGDQVFLNAGATEVVTAIYTYRAPESTWAPWFRLYVEFTLASCFAASVAMKSDLAQMYKEKAVQQGAKARKRDSQRQTARKVRTTRFLSNRRTSSAGLRGV
jgi:hypothetical protein